MKMKKIMLLFSMIAVLFSLTACSDGQGEVDFSYEDTNIIGYTVTMAYQFQNIDDATRAYYEASEEEADAVYKTGISNFDAADEECGEFKGYRSIEDGSVVNLDLSDTSSLTTEQIDEFLGLVDAEVVEDGEAVEVTLKAVYENRDADIQFVYVKNPAYAYSESASPFKPSEIMVTPDYTFGEKMAKAAENTLMGMGTVFVVLIFISLIIGQFERIGKASVKIENWWENRREKTAKPAQAADIPVKTAPVSVSPSMPNLMDDAQLVAVITAAVAAASSSSGGSDKLVVRSIRKAKR